MFAVGRGSCPQVLNIDQELLGLGIHVFKISPADTRTKCCMIPLLSVLCEAPRVVRSLEVESRLVAKGWGGGWVLVFNEDRLSLVR